MKNSNMTQCDRIVAYMKEYGSIDQYDALLQLGIMRLASRISELKKRGVPIKSTMKTVLNRYDEKCQIAEYSLTE